MSFLDGDNSAKIFFVLLSVFLWFLIKLSKEGYTGEVKFPVQYVNVPANKKLLNQPNDHLVVTLRSQGFEILKYKLRSLRPLEIDVSKLSASDEEHYSWNTDSKRDVVASQFGDGTEVVDIQPDTVHFNFSIVRNKWVKVYFKGKTQLSDFKTLYNTPQITPDSVMIAGSEEALSNIDSIFTEPLKLTEEVDSVNTEVNLQTPKNKEVEILQTKVRVKLLYTSLTEGSFLVPVEVVNLPEDFNITLFPKKVEVRYQVPLEDFPKITRDDFRAYVDYNEIRDMEEDRFLTVFLHSSPPYLKKVILEPRQLEYILTER